MSNDNTQPNPRTLTFRNTDNELLPGRFIYDQAHWRSEFKQFRVNAGRIRRYLGRYETSPGPHPYPLLPAEIQLKTASTDPFPPNRTVSPSVFYQTQVDVEFLSGANEILEDLDPGPLEDFQSTLDTLFKVTATALQPDTGSFALQSVAMTHYHGGDNEQFIVTGFNLWNFRRSNCVGLADFVLQQLWGLSRGASGPAATATVTRTPTGRQLPGSPDGGASRAAREAARGEQQVRQARPDR